MASEVNMLAKDHDASYSCRTISSVLCLLWKGVPDHGVCPPKEYSGLNFHPEKVRIQSSVAIHLSSLLS